MHNPLTNNSQIKIREVKFVSDGNLNVNLVMDKFGWIWDIFWIPYLIQLFDHASSEKLFLLTYLNQNLG